MRFSKETTQVDERFVEVPFGALTRAAIDGLVDEYVTRDGTDYGLEEEPLQAKRSAVLARLQSGEAVVVFDTATETANILSKNEVAMFLSNMEREAT